MNWIQIKTENDLPQIKGSCDCWAVIRGKVLLVKYQSGYFIDNQAIHEWKLVSHYIALAKPKLPYS